jgi:DNA polymerase-3 subunit epsilon
MRHRKRLALRIWLALAGFGLLALTVVLLLSSAGLLGDAGPIGLDVVLALIVCAVGGTALIAAGTELAGHFDDIERLRGDLLMAEQHGDRLPRRRSGTDPREDELGRLGATMADLLARRRAERSRPDARLEAVLATIADGLVLATENGLVVLINESGRTLLGRNRIDIGTSLYAALEREDVAAAVRSASEAGRPVTAMIRTVEGDHLACRIAPLPDHGGIALSVQATVVEHRRGVEHDLGLLDRLPEARPPGPETPLAELSASAVDTETTGLDLDTDRVLSVGVVRVHGTRVYRGASFERLVNPAVEIPSRATAVHGLTNAMIAAAPDFRKIVPELKAMLADTAIIGHNVRFDLGMLAREMERAGEPWAPPPALDTAVLYMAVEPGAADLELGAVAERLGITVQGRHTALGDSLVTAEIYVRLVPRLHDRGVVTLGDALERQRRAMRKAGIEEKLDPDLERA